MVPFCLYFGGFLMATSWLSRWLTNKLRPVRKTIRFSRNGPIVDELLPPAARYTGPVALRWLGFEPCGWLTALVGMNRARTAAEFRQWPRRTGDAVVPVHLALLCQRRITDPVLRPKA